MEIRERGAATQVSPAEARANRGDAYSRAQDLRRPPTRAQRAEAAGVLQGRVRPVSAAPSVFASGGIGVAAIVDQEPSALARAPRARGNIAIIIVSLGNLIFRLLGATEGI